LRDYGGLNWSLAVLAWVRYMQGRLEDAANLAREQLSESEALGNRWVTGILRMLMANVALWSGRPEHAIDDARAAIEIMVTLGDPWGQSQARAVLARALAASGELEMALKAAHESIPGAEHSTRQANAANAVGGIMRAQILAHAGEPEALAAALHAVGLAPDTSFSLELRNVLGRALLLAGRVPEAVAELEAVATAVRTADTGPGAANRAALALAYVAAGRVTEAAALAAAGATYLDRVQCAIAGAFAGLRLDAPGAEAAFDVPVKLADETEARLDQAVARLARACGLEALRSSRAVAAREEADRHLTQLGLGASGWRTLFALAANSTITSS
jgi:tetratricopeptide (TPR) repeat protein